MNRGFTIVEALIACLILGILAGIAVPSFQGYMEKGKETATVTDIGMISMKLKAVMLENPDALPDDLGTFTAKAGLPMVDPWGRPYQYLRLYDRPTNKGKARKDRSLVPINSDFDLYSKGPDGKTASPLTSATSRDDIIRANDGAFVGQASMYDP